MKARVAIFTQEGFLSGLAIKLDDGLILRTHIEGYPSLAWVGQEKKQEIIERFDEFLDAIEQGGMIVEGREVIDEFRI